MMKLSPSEIYLQNLFKDRYNIRFQKIDEKRGRIGSTPDFEVFQNEQRAFVCELKDFDEVEPLEENGWTIIHHSDGSVTSYRKSNAISRIKNAIAAAYKQLKSYSEPKVLVFLNHTVHLNVADFDETFKGQSILGEVQGIRYINTLAQKASDGEIKKLKWKIDLYIWIDSIPHSVTDRINKLYFRFTTKQGKKLICNFFSDTNEVQS
jgi:hypothetical protein